MGSFVITLREGFEAALIVGLIMAYISKTGRPREYSRAAWLGVGAAIAFSLAAGGILFAFGGKLEGTSEALYEGAAMLLAAAVLTWMVFWMRRQAATMGGHLREQVGDAIRSGGGFALAAVAFIGVAREGLETGLFLFATTSEAGALVTFLGAVLGLVVAAAIGVFFYHGALRLDLRKFFLVTSLLVIAFAAWLLSGAFHELGEVVGSEPLERVGPIVGLVYAVLFAGLYLFGTRHTPLGEHAEDAERRTPGGPAPAAQPEA
jgi:high-affinity iron transporter